MSVTVQTSASSVTVVTDTTGTGSIAMYQDLLRDLGLNQLFLAYSPSDGGDGWEPLWESL